MNVFVYRNGVVRLIPFTDVRPTDVCPLCWDGAAATINASRPHAGGHS